MTEAKVNNRLFRDSFVNRFRQFGFWHGTHQLARAMIRHIYNCKENIVFIIPDFRGYCFIDTCIKPFTAERIQEAGAQKILNEDQVNLFLSFISEGSKGLLAEVGGKLAAYGWVQFKGEYRFGKTGRMIIPTNCAIPKNLYVFPEYRGHNLGQKLNEARLHLIPPNFTPIAFIIPENRYAIRNWEKYGFRRVLYLKRWCWFNIRWRMIVTRLADGPQIQEIERALIQGHKGKPPAMSHKVLP